jgi:hypothetical protein
MQCGKVQSRSVESAIARCEISEGHGNVMDLRVKLASLGLGVVVVGWAHIERGVSKCSEVWRSTRTQPQNKHNQTDDLHTKGQRDGAITRTSTLTAALASVLRKHFHMCCDSITDRSSYQEKLAVRASHPTGDGTKLKPTSNRV